MSGAELRDPTQASLSEPPQQDTEFPQVKFEVPQSLSTGANRRTSVYDAVAGRVNVRGFHPFEPFASKHRDTASSGARELRPEEVLFRRGTNAYTKRSEKDESYFAHESLPSDVPLPHSDMLEAIHAYTADFYKSQPKKAGRHNYYSMDETALLAMGILAEELADEALGDTGDLVLVEGQCSSDEDEFAADDPINASQQPRRRRKRADTTLHNAAATSHEHLLGVRQKAKRRRLKVGSDADQDIAGEGK